MKLLIEDDDVEQRDAEVVETAAQLHECAGIVLGDVVSIGEPRVPGFKDHPVVRALWLDIGPSALQQMLRMRSEAGHRVEA